MAKKVKFDKDNILGWSEKEFDDLICEMVNLQVANNQRVHPVNQKVYFDHGHDWLMKRYGLNKKEIEKELLEQKIKDLQEKLDNL